MAVGVLGVNDIDQIQLAAQGGRPVRPFIEGLRNATLPVILEYGCLRWSHPSLMLPNLPAAIIDSPIGVALKEVESELGLRSKGLESATRLRLDPRPCAFFVLKDDTQLESTGWKSFETIYNRSSAKAGFPEKVASQLSVALHEMAANALIHAKMTISVLVGFHVRNVNGGGLGHRAGTAAVSKGHRVVHHGRLYYSGSRSHDTQSGVPKPTEDVLGGDIS